MHAFEASDERQKRLEDAKLDVDTLRKAVVHGCDDDRYGRLGNESKSNKSLQGAY